MYVGGSGVGARGGTLLAPWVCAAGRVLGGACVYLIGPGRCNMVGGLSQGPWQWVLGRTHFALHPPTHPLACAPTHPPTDPPALTLPPACTAPRQDDVLFHNLTVRETFEFAANMRLPAGVPRETRAALVTGIITELGLAKAQGTYIGVRAGWGVGREAGGWGTWGPAAERGGACKVWA